MKTKSVKIPIVRPSVKVKDFIDLLEGALVCAGSDLSLPTIASVFLEIKDGKLSAMATDRYRLIKGEMDVVGEMPTLLANRVSVKRFLDLVKKDAKSKFKPVRTVEIEPFDKDWKVSFGDTTMLLKSVDGNFPPCDRILSLLDTPPVTPLLNILFNPDFVVDFCKMTKKFGFGVPLFMSFIADEQKPNSIPMATFKIEHHAIKWSTILMPMRDGSMR